MLAPNWQQENFNKSSEPLILTGVGSGFNSDYIANTFPRDNRLIAGIDENHRTSGGIRTLKKSILTLRQIILLLTLGVNHRSSYSSLFNRAVNRLANIKRAKHFNTITESSARHPAVQGPKSHFCYWILVLNPLHYSWSCGSWTHFQVLCSTSSKLQIINIKSAWFILKCYFEIAFTLVEHYETLMAVLTF